MVETHNMLARLLPQGDYSLMIHELARMGHQAPDTLLGDCDRRLVCKFLAVPHEAASVLMHWLHQQGPGYWGYSTPGAESATLDLLCSAPATLVSRLRQEKQPVLQPLVVALEQALELQEHATTQLVLGDQVCNFQQRTYIMGVLNVTPDSFSDGGLYLQPEQAIKHAETMLAAGADIIDVGGQSSRPGAVPVPAEVEQARAVPVVREIVHRYGALVSIDTYRASVAAAALDAGAVLVNDISAMRFDAQMAPLIARRGASVALMHMQGTPQTMQQAPLYRHVLDDVYRFLAERLDCALQYGIARQRIVLDPGFGFGKTVQHNLDLLHGLGHLRVLGQPLLVGTSRKSFLGHVLRRQVWDRLEGTLATVLYAVLHGAVLVRVHDVAAVAQTVRLLEALNSCAEMQPPAHEGD
jgi:dihydropteroate synthase